MSSRDQDLFDISNILESIDSFTESIEAHFESVARSLQDSFRSSPWLPDVIKPKAPPPSLSVPPRVPHGFVEISKDWILEHRAATAAVVAFIGTGAFIIWRRRRSGRAKRRAKRARNGARTEVVILAGSPHSPLTRTLSLDLERRGFIVYIPVSNKSEERLVQAESRNDIKPLSLDITSPELAEEAVRKLMSHLDTPQRPIPSRAAYKLNLAAFILLPAPNHPISAIPHMLPSTWSDVLNAQLLAPFATVHTFLPLIMSRKTTMLFLNPSINTSLTAPSHAAESVVTGGIQNYISTLRKEIRCQDVSVVDVKLGHFNYETAPGHQQQLVLSQSSLRAEATKRRLEAPGVMKHPVKGSTLRVLHKGVFDAIVRGTGRNGTIFIGQGSRVYDLVGRWIPTGVIGWMLGAAPVLVPAPVASIAGSSKSDSSGEESAENWETLEPSA